MENTRNKVYSTLVPVILVLITAGVYWRVYNYEFISLDDPSYVQKNEHVVNGLTRQGIVWAFKTHTLGNWHPLTWLSFMADCHFFNNKARACHTTNLLLHLANTLLLFWVLKRMTGRLWCSGFVAALFALHPLHVESVAWVSERKDVLSTFFWMLTMWAYLRYTERPIFARYVPIILFFVLGLLAKTMLVTLPFIVLLLDYWPLRRLRLGQSVLDTEKNDRTIPGRPGTVIIRLVAEKVPLLVITAVFSIVAYLTQRSAGAIGSISIPSRLGNAAISYAKYMEMMFWPSKLAVYYPYPGDVKIVPFVISTAFLFLISVMAILLVRRSPYLIVGWLWYLVTLLPVIGLVKLGGQLMANRYTYVPLVGLFIIIAWAGADISKGAYYHKFVFGTAAVLALLSLTVRTWVELGYWRNSITLYERALAVTDNNALVYNNLSAVLAGQGRLNEAIEYCRQALRINPRYDDAAANMGAQLIRKGQVDDAIKTCRDYLLVGPDDYRVHKILADALVLRQKIRARQNLASPLTAQDESDLDEAVKQYLKSLRLKSDDFRTHYDLAETLSKLGKIEDAIEQYRAALRIFPDFTQAQQALKLALAKHGKSGEQKKQVAEP